jgi:HK97 family phage portal protein
MFKTLLKKLGYVPEMKSAFSPAAASTVVTIDQFTSNLLYNANYSTLAREGYIENVIANRCIRHTAECIANIDFDVLIDGESIYDRSDRVAESFRDLIKNPYVDYNWKFFVKSVQSHRPIAGRAYIYPELDNVGGLPSSIEFFRPDRVSIINSQDERVYQYQYNRGSDRRVFGRDEDGYFDLIDWRAFNPVSDTCGLSSIVPAGLSIDSHTEANKYNKQIVSNGAKPSGMISIQNDENSGHLDESQIKDLQDRIKQKLQSDNGGIMFMNANAKFEPINFSNAEMDWLNGIKANAIAICNALDYPPHLLGLESTTFNNAAEAKLELYENSAIPKAEEMYDTLSAFYSRKLGMDIEFKINVKNIVALAPRFKEMAEQARENFKSGLITQNEGRDLIGYEETPLGDDIFVDQNNQPMNQPLEG